MKFNFKWCVYIVLCAVILPLFCVIITPKDTSFAKGEFLVNETDTEITSIDGDFVGMKVNSYQDVYDALDNFKSEFGFNSSREALTFKKKVKSVTGTVYRFYQTVDDIKVYNSEVIVSTNSDGRITSINGTYYKNVKYDDKLNYSIEEAADLIYNTYDATNVTYLETNILTANQNCLCFVFEVYMLDDIFRILVCANDLEIVKVIKATASLSDTMLTSLPSLSNYTKQDAFTTYVNVDGETVTLSVDKYISKTTSEYFYILGDGERAVYVTHGQNKKDEENALYYASKSESGYFNDTTAVRAYDYIMQCYDFYLDSNNFGVSIDGLTNPEGEEILLLAIVHYDINYENAAFYLPYKNSTTGYFYFGDGNISKGTGSFVNGLDVVGHEYQHCISDSVVQLDYINESGAICEAYSDIFGACIEGNELTDANFWRMGEDIYTASNRYFRDMSNPTSSGCTASYESLYPLCTSSTCSHSNCDNGGVHYNSTLMTYATYIMYQLDPEFFTKSNILKLWYQTLTKLSEDTTFVEFAELMLKSAEELNFPEDNILDIEFAFATIDLPGYTGVKIWGDYPLQYLQGSGTIAYPYLINSVADLASVAYYINTLGDVSYASKRYQVNVNLNLNNVAWEGIGTEENPFNGVFNGGGKTITGLNVSGKTGEVYSGLFNYTGPDAYIYDIRVSSGNVTSNAEYVGAIAGLLKGTISGCSSALNIIGNKVGGLAGLVVNDSGGEKIVNSFTTCDLEGNVVGGLAAEFSSPLNTSVNLHLSGYITSSYTTGTLSGKVVGGIVGRANGLYLANVITTANLQDTDDESILGGLVGELAFTNINNSSEIVHDIVSNMILSAKVAVTFNNQNENLKQGLLIGVFTGSVGQGTLYIENTDIMKFGELNYVSNQFNTSYTKLIDVNIVEDNIFEGAFDFDSEKYYKLTSNWSVIDGIEAFDLVSTFEVKGNNQMLGFLDSDFWLNHRSNSFDSGYGTEDSPFIIKTAEQLALLAWLVADPNNEGYNTYYSSKYYELGADIDLSGKMWAGIGATHISVSGGYSSGNLYAFTGSFNGAGYSILNMSAISAYMVTDANSDGSTYKLIEFSPALFSVTNVTSSMSRISIPTIKNLTFEDVNNRGSYAAGVVAKVYMAINLDNVSVNNGNITSNFISGGLVASIDGLSQAYTSSEIVSNIINCDTMVNVSGRICGGVVGYVTNASTGVESTLNVVNYLNRGQIAASGEEINSEYINGSSYYYRPIVGSIVGVALIKNLNIINSINLGNIVSYNYGAYIGGYIGALGINGVYAPKTMNILIDGCKQIGDVYYIFDSVISCAGSVIGGTHQELACAINLTITDTTYTNQDESLIANNETITGIEVNSSMHVSNDAIGSGTFDIYNEDYYLNPLYFNSEYYWDSNQRTKLFVSVTFRDYNGEILGVIFLEKEQTSIDIEDTPIPERLSTNQYEYVFTGWNKDLNNISQSISVYAEYEAEVRKYTVTYLDEEGNIIETKTLAFGSSVNQDVEAPEKKSGFLFEYEFLRWGDIGQTVTGEVNLTPVYQMKLTTQGKIILIASAAVITFIIYSSYKKKKERETY